MPRKPTRRDVASAIQMFAPLAAGIPSWVNEAANRKVSVGPRATPEQDLQILCCDWLRTQPQLLFFSCPNHIYMGGADDDATYGKQANYMAKQRRMGLTPGVSDLAIIGRNRHGATAIAFAELKAPTGRISPSQAAFQDRANGLGCYTAIVRTLEDLQALLNMAQLLSTENPRP